MEAPPDNVIILGAGASADAGIPLLGEFIDTMLDIARRGKRHDKAVSKDDLAVIEQGLRVREELDSYHGRAAFDVWNIEDILSILAFSNQGGLERMTKAIGKVIEITCSVNHDGNLTTKQLNTSMYMRFWRALINWSQERRLPIPPILTFNYDLVLERSLLHALVGTYYGTEKNLNRQGIEVRYSADAIDNIRLKAQQGQWRKDIGSNPTRGTMLREFTKSEDPNSFDLLTIEILKLHGSLNFPRPDFAKDVLTTNLEKLIYPLDDPLILPPVFNKLTTSVGKDVWSHALQVLRSCKNLTICGYSLPATDIYMQYFLKAALGPNKDLNRIYVFDPTLFDKDDTERGHALRERYARNFSEPIQRRIEFQPWIAEERGYEGTMRHLTEVLHDKPHMLLLG